MNFGWKKTLIYSLIPVTLLCVLFEGTARIAEIWRPPLPVDYGWGFNPESRLFIPSPDEAGMMITDPAKLVSFVSQQFRLPKPENVFRIFVVGGSSVNYANGELQFLRFKLSLKYYETRLFEFINVGGCAYGTHRLAPLVGEILDYQPDLVLFYEGNNEFEETEQMRLVRPAAVPLQKMVYRSAFCRFVRDRWAAVQLSSIERQRNAQLIRMEKPDNDSGSMHRWTAQEVDEHMAAYRNNLALIISLCQTRHVPIVISTVASNLWKPRLDYDPEEVARIQSFFQQGKYEEGMAYSREILKRSGRHQASDTENGIIRELARQYAIPLADVEAAVDAAEPHKVPGETLFDDHCHLNDAGKRIMIALFEEQILKIVEAQEGRVPKAVTAAGVS